MKRTELRSRLLWARGAMLKEDRERFTPGKFDGTKLLSNDRQHALTWNPRPDDELQGSADIVKSDIMSHQ